MEFEFLNPAWLMIAPICAAIWYVATKFHIKLKLHHADLPSVYFPFSTKQFKSINKYNKKSYVFHWLVLILMSIALSQPVTKLKILSPPEKTQDLFFIIDVSVGMAISDYIVKDKQIDRLTYVKLFLLDFISQLNNNRIGTMLYADDAYILTPMTPDKDLVKYNIRRIRPAVAGRRNNLGNALNTFLEFSNHLDSKPTVIVLSQGANLEKRINLEKITDKFSHKNIKLHLIGLGSENDHSTDQTSLIFDPIDKKTLTKVSEKTGGEFFWAGKKGELRSALNIIKNAETLEIPVREIFKTRNYYHWVLYCILLLIFTAKIITFMKYKFR